MKEKPAYRIALRPDDDGELDDVVVNNVAMFRAEMMTNRTMWMACYFPDSDEELTFWVHAHSRKGLTFGISDSPPESDAFIYEAGSLT